MVTTAARIRIRQLYLSGMNATQIQHTTGYASWIIDRALEQIKKAKSKSMQQLNELRERQMREQIVNPIVKKNGKRIPPNPVRCNRCRCLAKELDDRYQLAICCECGRFDDKQKAMTRKRVLAGVAMLLLMVCAGCQSPRHAQIEVRVAGQEVVMNFRK